MKWTLFFGCLLILSISLCGCIGSPCGPCGPYGSCYSNQFGMCADECGGCDPCGTSCGTSCGTPCGTLCSSMNYAYGGGCATPYCGLPGAPIRTIGCGAACVAATPVSWLAQILRGTNYPCHGCGDELYWGDYGYVPNDFCNPCTYGGQWAGNDRTPNRHYGGCDPCGNSCGNTTVCQQGLSSQYPAVGSYVNQMYAPVFQDKIASTHARTPLNYGLRGPFADACCDPCGCSPCGYDPCCNDSCGTDSCSTGMCGSGMYVGGHSGCDTGCDVGYTNGYGARISPGYAPTRQQVCLYGTGKTCDCNNGKGDNTVSNVTQASYRSAKPSSSTANKVYLPVKR